MKDGLLGVGDHSWPLSLFLETGPALRVGGWRLIGAGVVDRIQISHLRKPTGESIGAFLSSAAKSNAGDRVDFGNDARAAIAVGGCCLVRAGDVVTAGDGTPIGVARRS